MARTIDQDTGEITSLAVATRPAGAVTVTEDRIDLIKRTIAKGCTDEELEFFVAVCNRTGLDPFAKQIYAIKRWDGKANREVMAIQVGIDGLRLQALRSHVFGGEDGPYWCGPDGRWVDVWLSDGAPAAAKVGVRRVGQRDWTFGVATYKEYCQKSPRDGKPMGLWATMPANQLAKCAEAQALRKLFPAELAGMGIAEELSADMLDDLAIDARVQEAMASYEERTGKPAHTLGNATYDNDYYSPERIKERDAAAAERRQQQTHAAADGAQVIDGEATPVADDAPGEAAAADAAPPDSETGEPEHFVPVRADQKKKIEQLASPSQLRHLDWSRLSEEGAALMLDSLGSAKS